VTDIILNSQNVLESSNRRTPENGGVDVDENIVERCWAEIRVTKLY
jgi:hypothetical protein